MNELRVTVDRLTRDSKTGLMVDVCASKKHCKSLRRKKSLFNDILVPASCIVVIPSLSLI